MSFSSPAGLSTPRLPRRSSAYDADNDEILYSEPDGNVSDADSDYLELQGDIAKLDVQRQQFLRQHWGLEEPPRRRRGRPPGTTTATPSGRGGRPGRKRGPRKAAPVPAEVRLRLADAGALVARASYGAAQALLLDIIKTNAETYEAWTLLAAIYEDVGDAQLLLMAKFMMAQLRPRDVGGWLAAAEFALEDHHLREMQQQQQQRTEEEVGGEGEETAEAADLSRMQSLVLARLLYSGALKADRDSHVARFGRAGVELEMGHASNAAADYLRGLKRRPYNMEALRNLAEASFDSTKREAMLQGAISAYQAAIAHARAGGRLENDGSFGWVDATIYPELYAGLGQHDRAIRALKSSARWMLGRQEDFFWDMYTEDDREWDRDDERRDEVPEFKDGSPEYSPLSYGLGLPLELRAKMAVYRLKLGHEEEALEHLSWLDPSDPATPEALQATPHVLREVAAELLEKERAELAMRYFEMYRLLNKEVDYVDADGMVQQGKCYVALGDDSSAEDCFLAAMDADEDNVEARFELAKQYEKAQEREEAFKLVNEALQLGRQQGKPHNGDYRFILTSKGKLIRKPRTHRKRSKDPKARQRQQSTQDRPRKRRMPRLGKGQKRIDFEQEMSRRLKEKYELCQSLKSQMEQGDKTALGRWMDAAKELIDDFRSCRGFYTWEKYVDYLGYSSLPRMPPNAAASSEDANLTALAHRLHQGLAPAEGEETRGANRQDHRGIPFHEWLDLFIEYALHLAVARRQHEAYSVCESARDSNVYRDTESLFLIHLTWAACAIHANDEETCVSVARYFMRDSVFSSDGYRIFAATCRLCRSPSSWYNSDPIQKFMLRQIRRMDAALTTDAGAAEPREKGIDLCLLVIYGHILLASRSFSYALAYFVRAASLDPDNAMVSLSTGLSYVHWALKRQSENRQYMLVQGFHFLFRYRAARLAAARSVEDRQEAHFNIARTYHLLGLQPLAVGYYAQVLDEAEADLRRGGDGGRREGFVVETAYNLRTFYMLSGDMRAARNLTRRWLVVD